MATNLEALLAWDGKGSVAKLKGSQDTRVAHATILKAKSKEVSAEVRVGQGRRWTTPHTAATATDACAGGSSGIALDAGSPA
jgi:hypothetical protein